MSARMAPIALLLVLISIICMPACSDPPPTVALTSVTASPSIGAIAVQTPGPIEKYAKFEIAFAITSTVAANVYFPFDAATPPGVPGGTGITVDALLLPPGESNWNNARVLPCFYYQPVQEAGSGDNVALLPTGKPDWRCRFTPDAAGVWQYRVRATDAGGTATTGDHQFTCVQSGRKGFVKTSSTDPRYFEWSDGTPFITPLVNVEDGNPLNSLLRARTNIQKWGENGVRFVRWFPTGEGANYAVIPFGDDLRSSWGFGPAGIRWDDVDAGAGKRFSFSPYYYTSESVPAVRGARYRLSVRAKVTGDKVLRLQIARGATPLGELTIPANGGWTSYTLQVTNTINADVLTAFVRDGYSENGNTSGAIRLHSLVLQRDETGAGDWGPNLLVRSDPDTYNYVDQRGAALMDEVLRLSEQYGVYHKLTLFHKNDQVLNRFLPDGTITSTWDSMNVPFYSQAGQAARWYEDAYVRYFVARWSYSPALHSLELANENHLTQASYDAGFAVAQLVHTLSPRHILMTNSFWGYFVEPFWTDAGRGYWMDYADKHWYANRDSQDSELISRITDDSAANVRECWQRFGEYKEGYNYAKPIVRGETGVAVSGTQPQDPDIERDTQGVYYHKKLWAHVGAVGYLCDGEWYPGLLNDRNQWGMYAAYGRFMQGEPISNGRYQAIGTDLDGALQINITDSTGGLRAWGARDAAAGRVLLWIDNADHTWRHVVDGVPISPVSGTLTVHGLPQGMYTAEWWNTTTGAVVKSETYPVGAGGDLVFAVRNLATDEAAKMMRSSLLVSKTTSSLTAHQGQVLTYTLTVDNAGLSLTQTAPITVTDRLPVGLAFSGALCAASRGAPPVCSAGNLYWQGTLPTTTVSVALSYTVDVTTAQSTRLANTMNVEAGLLGVLSDTVTILANPSRVFLPVITKAG